MKTSSLEVTYKRINTPMTDTDIIYIQDKFLINGFHYFKVKTFQEGRFIITSILDSLNYYRSIGFYSDSHDANVFSHTQAHNIKKLLYNYNNSIKDEEIYTYFMDYFNFDFFWLEVSEKNSHFTQILIDQILNINLHKFLPIIVLMHD